MDDKQLMNNLCKKVSRKPVIKQGEVNSVLSGDDPWDSLRKSLELFSNDFMEKRNQPVIQIREYPFEGKNSTKVF
jgi:hypothetical protein